MSGYVDFAQKARKVLAAAAALLLGLGLIWIGFWPHDVRATNTGADQMLSRPCVQPEPCHQTWTLTSRLGHILDFYEAQIGPRNRAFRLLGVEFTSDRRPRVWYPDFGKGPNNLIIQLTREARHGAALALFQLGHEAFHVIEPIKPGDKGSYLEEGLASYFSLQYMKSQGFRGGERLLTETQYRHAYDQVVRVVALHDDFYKRLRQLREITRSFSRLSEDEFRAAFPNTPALMARNLVSEFPTSGNAGNRR